MWSRMLLNLFISRLIENPDLVPTHIVGDLDSAKPDILDYYEQKGVVVQGDPEDQDTNDFEKAYKVVCEVLSQSESVESPHKDEVSDKVLLLFPFGGRMDHTLGSMHVYCQLSKK